MITIGIDPGLTGAVAFLGGGFPHLEDLPTTKLPGNGLVQRRIDGRALAVLIRRHVPADQTAAVYVEDVHAMGGSAVQTMGSMMRSLGAIEAVLEVLRLPTTMVRPQAWKKHFNLGASKSESLAVARRLYPTAGGLHLAKHHNRAEALLIAHFGQQA